MVEAYIAPFVRSNPYVDEVIVTERKTRWKKLKREGHHFKVWREVLALLWQLHQRRFTISVDLHGLFKSGVISWAAHAQRRLAPACPGEKEGAIFLKETTPWPEHPTTLAEKYLAMLRPLGIESPPRRPVLVIPEDERKQAHSFLAKHGLSDTPYAACCVTSSSLKKDWVIKRWGELAERLWQECGMRTVFIAGPESQERYAQLANICPAKPVSAAGELSMLQSAAVVQDATVVIGVDTGFTYAGLATDRPTVVLYGSTPYEWLRDEPNVAVCVHPMECSPCKRHPSCTDYACMRAISVDEVVNTVQSMVEAMSCLT
jgi:heptosyltransferase-1